MQAVFTEWLEYDFMKNALLAVLIITPLFGILGTMIVNKKMAFFSDSLGHSALTGIAIGAVLGMKDTTLSMILFAIVFALLLNKIAGQKYSIYRYADLCFFFRKYGTWTCYFVKGRQFQQIFIIAGGRYFEHYQTGNSLFSSYFCSNISLLGAGI